MQFLQLDHFAARLNETFDVEVDGGLVPFVLVEARPLPFTGRAAAGAVREPFSLLFLNASPILFAQRIYTMKNPTAGEFGIFLVPIARNKDGFIYQAVFN